MELQEHGALPYVYLHGLTQGVRKSHRAARETTRDFFHEKNHNNQRYLTRLKYGQGKDKSRAAVYWLTDASVKVLKDEGKFRENLPSLHHDDPRHDIFASCLSADIKLGCLQRPDLYEFYSQPDLLDMLGVGGYEFVFRVYVYGWKELKPDRVVAVKYLQTGKLRYFLIEADRRTEVQGFKRTSSTERKTIQTNSLQYQYLIADKSPDNRSRDLLQLEPNQGIVNLNFTVGAIRMNNMMEIHKGITSNDRASYSTYYPLSQFSKNDFRPPAAPLDIFNTPLNRVGYPPFVIAEA